MNFISNKTTPELDCNITVSMKLLGRGPMKSERSILNSFMIRCFILCGYLGIKFEKEDEYSDYILCSYIICCLICS